MREKPDMPLTPVELFRRGIEITREIRGRIEEARAYYLGRSSREPAQPLSEVFDPMRGPILKYFVQTVRTITRTPFIERHCQSAAFREFRQSSEATLEELRLLAIQLAMCLGVPDKTDRRRSVGQALKTSVYFFRIANGRFFRQLPWNGSLVHLLLKNRSNEGFGIYIADRLLNDIAKAFEIRERQLRGESAAVEHEFFTSQFERIERKIDNLSRGMRKNHAYEMEILSWVSDEPEKYATRDGRRLDDIKRQMVDLASHAIFHSPPEQATAIALRYFNAFRETPGAYANFDSFMRQVRRTLPTFRT